jgi:predicted dithiol-disulfide oxidoreductase (DUF899 family)
MQQHSVASQEQSLAARKALLLREKEFTHLRDQINAERLDLPWVKIEELCLRHFEGHEELVRIVRGPKPAHGLSFDARPGLG